MRDVLHVHWLPIAYLSADTISYYCEGRPVCPSKRLLVEDAISRCPQPPLTYLCDLYCPVSVLAARRVLRSAARGELLVPQAHLATVQQRAFSVVGPSAWNDIPVELRSLLMARPSQFHISLKSFFFGHDWAGSASIRLVSRRGVI